MILRRIIRWINGIGHLQGFGVQSPFAYGFVSMLHKERHRLDTKDKRESLVRLISETYKSSGGDIQVTDIADYDTTGQALNALPPNTLLVLKNPYRNKSTYFRWKEIIADRRVTISFDLYHVGVISINKGLSKHNYIVNI